MTGESIKTQLMSVSIDINGFSIDPHYENDEILQLELVSMLTPLTNDPHMHYIKQIFSCNAILWICVQNFN